MRAIIQRVLKCNVDNNNKMGLSVVDIEGEVLLVSQFTLYGNIRKGNRPSYSDTMPSNKAEEYYKIFVENFKIKYKKIESGIFGENMNVSLINSGPVTIILDTGALAVSFLRMRESYNY